VLDRLAATTEKPLVCLDDFNDYYDPQCKRANIRELVASGRVILEEGSICDEAFFAQVFQRHAIDKVVHLAARAGIRASVSDPVLYDHTNCRGTLILLGLASRFNVSQVVTASSSSVYGDRQRAPFREDDQDLVPESPYAVTKLTCEFFAQVAHALHGLSVVCLRFFTVYGPRNRPDMAVYVFADAIEHGRELPLFGDGSARRDFTYVDDIVDGVVASLDLKPGFAIINLGNNRPVTVRELIDELEKGLGKKAKIKYLPAQPGDVGMTCADISRAHRLLGYEPKVPLAEGVARFIQWCRAR
jgi:UDP-glucuronate 4-epimerase